MRSRFKSVFLPICAALSLQAQVRPKIHPLQTVTLSTRQVLVGDRNGKPTMIAGELRLPPSTTRLPAVILVHGSGGVSSATERWASELNGLGIATFTLDTFSGRGITSTVNDQSQLDSLAMLVDAYKALELLAKHPRIDSARIAIMGFSKGAVASVYSATERFRKLYAPAGVTFAAHIGLYTPCNVTYLEDDKLTGAPLRLFHGIADDYVAIGPCRAWVERLKQAGVDVTLSEYPEANHSYDSQARGGGIVSLPEATTTRHCAFNETERGAVVNTATRKPFDPTDACIEKGTHVGYNEAATIATTKAVKEFLTARFRLSEAP